jgi:Mor family transcriptional regulator
MGMEPKEKTERNRKVVEDYNNGLSFVELVSKYRITSQRIYQIIKAANRNGAAVQENRG